MSWTILAHLLRRCTRLLMVLPSRQLSACDFYFYHGLDGFCGFACGRKNRSKSLLLSLGLRPCSQVGMFIHTSKFACLNLPTCLVCRWQYKIGSHGATTISFAWCEGLPSSGFLFYHGLDVFSIRIRKRSGAWRALP